MQVDVNDPNNPFSREVQEQQTLIDVNSPNNPFINSVINRDKTEVDADLESGEWLLKDNFSTAAAFLEGATLGWSDEAGVGVAAAAVSATGDETYEQAYKRLKGEYDAVKADFEKRQPGAAMAAEIGGAIVSPVSKIGMAAKGAKTLTGLAARGAVEGGIYGAGKAKDTSSLLSEAGEGALFGAGSGAIIGAGGWLLKRRIKAPLDKDGTFTPITLAAKRGDPSESILHSFYHDVVGPSFGGKGVIRAQEEAVVAPLVLKQAERVKALRDFKRASQAEGAEATASLRNAVDSVSETGKIKGVDVKAQAEIAEEVIKGKYDKFLGAKGEIIARKTQQLKNTIDNNNDMLRLAAFDNSVPVGAKKAQVRDVLESTNPNVAMYKLEKLWKDEGFRSIKDISFRMKPEELLTQIEKKVSADTTLSLLAGKTGVRSLIEDGLVTLAAKRNPKTGRIKGEDLSAVRNSFGMAASKMSDEGGQAALMQGLYREIQGVIDTNMKKQLSGKRLDAFESDVAAWASQTVLRDSVTRASVKAGRQGKFTADEWVASIKKNSPAQARKGEGPLRKQAEEIAALTAKQEGAIISTSDKLANKLAGRRANELKIAKNKAAAEKASIAKETIRLKKNLRSDPANAERLGEALKREDELKAIIAKNDDELKNISKARTDENPTWFQQLAATSILGALSGTGAFLSGGAVGAGGLAATAAGLAGTVGLAKGLATPQAQRVIAGQTPTQEALRRGLQKPVVGGMSAVDVITSFPRVGAGMLTGEQQNQ